MRKTARIMVAIFALSLLAGSAFAGQAVPIKLPREDTAYAFTGFGDAISVTLNGGECTIGLFTNTILIDYTMEAGAFQIGDSVITEISGNEINFRQALTYDAENDRFCLALGELGSIRSAVLFLTPVGATNLAQFEYQNGNVYEGQLANGTRHGQATFFWSDGSKYVGEYTDGAITGYGRYYDASGALVYAGQFVDGATQ